MDHIGGKVAPVGDDQRRQNLQRRIGGESKQQKAKESDAQADDRAARGYFQKPQRGVVIAAGPGKLLDNGSRAALAVGKGDEVLYGKYAGNDVKLGAKEVKILRESDILAKIVK